MGKDKFQEMLLEHLTKLTQQLSAIDSEIAVLHDRLDNYEIILEQNIKPLIDAIAENISSHAERTFN